MKERWHLGLNIVQSMDFYTAILLPECRPAEDSKAEFNGCRIEGIHVSAEVEYLLNSQSTSLFHHIVGKLFKDVVVSVLVCFRQVAACDRFTEPKMVSLAAVSLNRYYQVP